MRGPYCTGALTPSGNAARVRAPQAAHLQSWARCSVTISGAGAGRSNTWRALWPTVISSVMADPQVAHDGGTWSMTWSGAATCSRVSPLCPFWPPDGLFDGPRRLWVRAGRGGFLSPSLDGGLPLFELFSPSRRSSSAIRAFRAAISAACAAISAISSSRDGSRCESGFGLIESLNRKPIPLSRKIYRRSHPATQPRELQDKIVLGAAGGDRGVRDFIVALDAATGKLAWRKYV